MAYYQFTFENLSQEQSEVLVAQLNEIGFTGFEESAKVLKAFISDTELCQENFDKIIDTIAIKYSKSIVEDKNWNAIWESGFEPVIVFYPNSDKPFVHLRANFHKPLSEATYDLEVTPKMSFGTGHHATTHLMVEQMSRLDLLDKDVIDFGTGTGVLALLAEKMGASKIIAIDNDEWSITNATENVAKNNCTKIALLKAETIPAGFEADIMLANINLNIIIANIDNIKNACRPGATILFSGIMRHDEPLILEALTGKGFIVSEVLYRDDWLVICVKNS